MKKLLLLTFVAFTTALSFGQCTPDPKGGTDCVAPLKTTVGQGQSTTFTFDMTPASINAPCVKLAAGSPFYRFCPQSNQITVDFGDGKGFVQLQGPKGNDGVDGPPGPPGVDGKDGQSIKGDTGAAGQDGVAATVTIGSVSSGTTPVVWNSGNANAAVLNFVLQKGDAGKDGAPGIVVGKTITVDWNCPRGKGTIPAGWLTLSCVGTIRAIK